MPVLRTIDDVVKWAALIFWILVVVSILAYGGDRSKSSRYSQTTKTTSKTTPIVTKDVKNESQESSEERQMSRLSISILRADSSMQKLRDHQVELAEIQLIVVIVAFAIAIGIVLFMHCRS